MKSKFLKIYEVPQLDNPRMVIGLTGWMDGGEISSGVVEFLAEEFGSRLLAEIKPDDFYLYNFPGSVETSSLFRPYTQIVNGMVKKYQDSSNYFYYNELHNLICLLGKEPHMRWNQYAQGVFQIARQFGVGEIYYVGSFAGIVPHSRDPRIFANISNEALRQRLEGCNVKFSEYQGPAGIATCLIKMAEEEKIDMINLIAEIPPYVQGKNPKCIEAVLKRLARLLNLEMNLDVLKRMSDELEKKLDQAIAARQDLAEHVEKLEENYDQEIFDSNMGDLKQWLETKGIRLD